MDQRNKYEILAAKQEEKRKLRYELARKQREEMTRREIEKLKRIEKQRIENENRVLELEMINNVNNTKYKY